MPINKKLVLVVLSALLLIPISAFAMPKGTLKKVSATVSAGTAPATVTTQANTAAQIAAKANHVAGTSAATDATRTIFSTKKSTAAPKTTSSLKRMYFTRSSYASLENVRLLSSNGQAILSYTVTLHNGDSTPLDYYDYFMRVTSKSGTDFTVNLVPSTFFTKNIQPGSTVSYQYYSILDQSTKLSDLKFAWNKWDFSLSSFTRVIGQFQIPSNYDVSVPENATTTINTPDLKIGATIKSYGVTNNSDYTFPSLVIDLKNLGNGSIPTPSFQYFIKTATGDLYPLDISISNQNTNSNTNTSTSAKTTTNLNPLDTEEVDLSGSIPKGVSTKNSDLVITNSLSVNSGTKLDLPVASFKLDNSLSSAVTSNNYTYTNSSGSYQIKLNSVQQFPSTNQQLLIANFTLTNNSSNAIPTFSLGGSINLDDNVQVKATAVPLNKTISINPKQSVQYQLVCEIPSTSSFSTYSIQLTNLDKGMDIVKFSKKGNLTSIPMISSTSNTSSTVTTSNQDLKASIVRYGSTANGTYTFPSLVVDLQNLEKSSVPAPNFQYSLLTASGMLYPLNLQSTNNNGDLKPLSKEEIDLAGSVPVSESIKNSTLVITNNVTTDSTNQIALPVAAFKLGDSITSAVVHNNSFVYTNDNGSYSIKLNGLHRSPWQNQDVLEADVAVTNNGGTTLPTLNMSGQFNLDDNVKLDGTAVLLDQVTSINPKQTVHYQLIAKIPATTRFSKVGVQLQDADQKIDIVEFTQSGALDSIPEIKSTDSYDLNNIGMNFSLSVPSADTFVGQLSTGATSDIYSAQIDLKNNDSRFADVPLLSARFVSEDGTVYPAQIETVTDSIIPGGDALVRVWTVLPKGTDTTGMKLIAGEAVTGSTLSANSDTPSAYVNAVKFDLPTEPSTVDSTLSNMALGPYNLNIYNMTWPKTIFNKSNQTYNVSLNFKYTLNQDLLLKANETNHHYLIVLEGANGKEIISKQMTIGDTSASGNTTTSDNQLSFGNNTLQLSSVVNNTDYNFTSFTLNIYDEFQSGYRHLLSSLHFEQKQIEKNPNYFKGINFTEPPSN